jgi:HlyD family secretion protein
VVKNGKIEQKVVKAGIQNELYYEIQSGLAAEDEVVVAPYTAISRLLKAGMPVKVVPKELLTDKGE